MSKTTLSILRLHKNNPDLSATEIGARLNLNVRRIWQVLTRYGCKPPAAERKPIVYKKPDESRWSLPCRFETGYIKDEVISAYGCPTAQLHDAYRGAQRRSGPRASAE